MLFTTPSEWAVLLLTLLAGWLLGLASHSGGRKWRERYSTERDAHAASRRDAEARLTASEARLRELDADRGRLAESDARIAELERDRAALERANARVAELERENSRLASAPPATTAAPVRTVTSAPAEPVPLTRRVVGERPKRGWFDWGPGNDPRARRL